MTAINALSSTTGSYLPVRASKKEGQDPMAKVADALGLSSDDLKTALKSGKSLNEVAEEQGVSHDDLITAIKQGRPDAATEMTDEMAEKIAGTVGKPTPPPGEAPGGLKGESSAVTDQATSASSLVSMLQSNGVDLTQLRNVLNSGDLLDVAA
jgi:DNA-binding phage protein